MRLILKTADGHFQIYWVTSGKNSILGWFSGDWLRQELNISNDFHFEAHFTFPQDGNFHNSYKYINKDHQEFINVYWNKVKIKTIINGQKTKTEQTRQEFAPNILGHLVPQYKPDTLDLVKHFIFTGIGFNVFKGRFKVGKTDIFIEENRIQDTDLVVDVSQMDNVSLNIGAGIHPSEVIPTAEEPSKVFCKYLLLPNSRNLNLYCRIDPLNIDNTSADT